MAIRSLTGSTGTPADPGSGGGVRAALAAIVVGVVNFVHTITLTDQQVVILLSIVTPSLFVLAWAWDKWVGWRLPANPAQ